MPLNIDWQQILLHLLNFLILGVGLYLLLYKPVRKFMKRERTAIRRGRTRRRKLSKRRGTVARNTRAGFLPRMPKSPR